MRPRSWGDWYELALLAALSAALLFALGHRVLPDVLDGAAGRGYAEGRIAVALLLFVLGVWVRAWYFAGPLAVPAGRLQWLMWRREPGRWLRRERTATCLAGAVLAAVPAACGGLALAAAAPALAVWVLLLLAQALTLWLQRRDLDAVARALPYVLCALGVVLAVGTAWNAPAGFLCGAFLLGVPALAWRGGTRPRSGDLTPRWQLHRAARNRWSLGAGVTMLDHEVLRVVRHREARTTRRPLPPFVYRLPGPLGPAGAVLARTFPAVLPSVALALPLVLALDRMLGPTPALLLTALLELSVTVTMVRGSEQWLRTNALSRTWATTGGARVPLALALPGLAVSLAVAGAVSLALGLPLPAALPLLALPAAILARRRAAHAGPDTGALLATPVGPLPLHTANRLTAGPDMVLLSVWLASRFL